MLGQGWPRLLGWLRMARLADDIHNHTLVTPSPSAGKMSLIGASEWLTDQWIDHAH